MQKLGRWLLTQATWRTVVRTTGLGLMVYLVAFEQHPDATALVACATMIGLASFVRLEEKEDKL